MPCAISILIYIAKSGKVVNSEEISLNTMITFNYVRKILRKLSKSNFVGIKRGSGGGLSIKERPENISLYHVINAM